MLNDLIIAGHRLLRSPTFTALAVITLAVGIGASASILSVVHGVLISPLPYPDSGSLVGVWHRAPALTTELIRHPHITYVFYRDNNRVFEEMGLFVAGTANLTGGERPAHYGAVYLTPSVFEVLGVRPQMGRVFVEEDGEPNAEPVVIFSHSLWQRGFGGDPSVVGRVVSVDGLTREVVGVMPPEFRVASLDGELFLPMEVNRTAPERGIWNYMCVARLRAGVSVDAAAAEMAALTARLHEAYPDPEDAQKAFAKAELTSTAHAFKQDVVGDVAGVLWVVFGCVMVVLVVAVANVVNLFLVRAEVRHQEVALRSALGASRSDLAKWTMAESFIVVALGALVGLSLAVIGLRFFVGMAPSEIPRLEEIHISGEVILFAIGIALLSGVFLGAIPLMRRTGSIAAALREGGRSATDGRSRHRIRHLLVVGQVALALVLMAVSGLMVRSLLELRAVESGCETAGVTTMHLPIPDAIYSEIGDALAFYREVLDRVRGVPGVDLAGMTTGVPLDDGGVLLGHIFEDFPLEEDDIAVNYRTHVMLPGALETLGVPLLAGRGFDEHDLGGDVWRVVISESLAERFWSDPADAVGRRVMPGQPQDGGVWYTIVGVVGDVRYGGLAAGETDALYYPFWSLRVGQDDTVFNNELDLLVKAELSSSLESAMLAQVWAVNADVPVTDIRTMEDVVSEASARTRFTMMLLLVAAGVSLVLGSVGLYGVISYVVSLRTREIGIRVAFGADPGAVSQMVLKQGMMLALAGIGLGLVGSVAAGRLAVSQLYGVNPGDPFTLGCVSAVLLAVALLASYLPARRAASMDPLDALRHD